MTQEEQYHITVYQSEESKKVFSFHHTLRHPPIIGSEIEFDCLVTEPGETEHFVRIGVTRFIQKQNEKCFITAVLERPEDFNILADHLGKTPRTFQENLSMLKS